MNTRTRGVLVSLQQPDNNFIIGSVEVLQGPLSGQKLPLFSIAKESPALVAGLEVDFIISNLRKDGKSIRGAIDLNLEQVDLREEIRLQDEVAALQLAVFEKARDQEKKNLSILWDVISKVESDEIKNGLGKGGPKHRYLQVFVKALAEQFGWSAKIEVQIPGGQKATDVVLEKDGYRIACEIAISTVYIEYQNLQKNIAAGFDSVISISTDTKTVSTIKKMTRQRLGQKAEKIHYLLPEQLSDFLSNQLTGEAKRIKDESFTMCHGYRVRVKHILVSPELALEKIQRVNAIVAQSIIRERMMSAKLPAA